MLCTYRHNMQFFCSGTVKWKYDSDFADKFYESELILKFFILMNTLKYIQKFISDFERR